MSHTKNPPVGPTTTGPTEDDTMTAARQHLTPKQLEAWELHINQGLSLNTTAAALGVSVSTIRGHLRAAAHRLNKETSQ